MEDDGKKVGESTLNMSVQLATISQKLEQIHKDFQEVKQVIRGEGSEPGLVVRVDRLEQSQKKSNQVHLLWGGALVTSIVAWFMEHFTK